MQRRNVDFPEPDGPRMTTTSPVATSMSMPLSTSNRSKDLCTLRALTKGGGTEGASATTDTGGIARTTASHGRRSKAGSRGGTLHAAPAIALDDGQYDIHDHG